MKVSLLAAVAASFFTITEAASGFKNSCKNYRLCGVPGQPVIPFALCADCKRIDGTYQSTRHILDNCIVNRDNVLYGQQDGGFGNSCGGCIVTYAGRTDMTCFCNVVPGSHIWQQTNVIDMNDLIGNDNGLLRCFDRWGAPA